MGASAARARPASEAEVIALLDDVPDPEIPVLSLTDLGIVRWARLGDDAVTVGISPTYTGCPATEVIEASVRHRLEDAGFDAVRVERVLSPPWTTDWITARGRERLRDYGIAPPADGAQSKRALLGGELQVACPRCGATATRKVSEFGSTPCKASYKCNACLEPFEYFKCL